MDKAAVINAVKGELARSESFMDSRIARERKLAYDYYYGREFGNEQEGRSRVISCDVAQAVDSAVPQIVEVFVSGDKAVEFAPRGQEDVKAAEQATIGANYVFFTQNNGYALAHDFIKDGLLQKTGAFTWKWEEKQEISERVLEGLEEPAAIQQVHSLGEGEEIVGIDDNEGTYNLRIKKVKKTGRVRISVPAPEEIVISPDSMTLEVMDMPFIAHTPLLTRSDLIEMGYKASVVDTLPAGDDDSMGEEKNAREDRNDQISTEDDDKANPVYRYKRCFIRLDEDGDGVAELREICIVGSTILHDEPTDHIPIAIWTPKVMPHEVVGISLADDVMDLQLLKSTIWRMTMDSWYQAVFPRLFTTGDVNMDDVMTLKPGAQIRGEPNSTLTPIAVPFTGQHGLTMMEYSDQEKDARVGFSALAPGMDPDSINKTATFVREMTNQTNSRAKMIARNAAEFGFKPLFKGIMYLLARHQTEQLMVRLNNQFVPIDPETWNKEYDMSCNVGLGVGNKEQQLMQLQSLGMDLQAIAQTPFAGVLLDAQKVYNYVEKKANLAGFKDVTVFLNNPVDPQTGEALPPPPPPEPESVQVAKIKAQTDQQNTMAKVQADAQTAQITLQADQEREKSQAQADMAVAQNDAQMKAQLERYKIDKQMELEQFKAELQAKVELEKAAMMAQVQANRPEPRPGA